MLNGERLMTRSLIQTETHLRRQYIKYSYNLQVRSKIVDTSKKLVSVIIPCYNHAAFLPDAIESVSKQTYPHLEIIVVDDGSTDNTEEVAKRYPDVQYHYQKNGGLSAARNTGVRLSKGEYLVFLDADDLLYKDAIAYNLDRLQQQPQAAFVSGTFDFIASDQSHIKDSIRNITADHYLNLLRGNYISMHATVMYRRWVFKQFSYDTSLRACEDYDLYLNIARHHPVIHHTKKIASYRIHGTNMSGNFNLMLRHALLVLKRQLPLLKSHEERKAYEEGVSFYKKYYCDLLYVSLRTGEAKPTKEYLELLRQYKIQYYLRYHLMRLL